MCRYVGVIGVVLLWVAPVQAQEWAGSLAGGIGFVQSASTGDCRFDGCRPVVKGFAAEGSVNLTDTVAIAGRVRVSHSSLTATRDEVPFTVRVRDFDSGGGIRVHGPGSDVRAFVQLIVGLNTVDVRGELGGFSESGLVFSPGGGVEVDIVESVALRVLGEWSSRKLFLERTHNASAFVELVLRVGRRCVTAAC